jgi:hypothetical protein
MELVKRLTWNGPVMRDEAAMALTNETDTKVVLTKR